MHPGHWREGLGVSRSRRQAAGVPVVGFRCGRPRRSRCTTGETGVLVRAAKTCRNSSCRHRAGVIDDPDASGTEMGAAGRERMQKEFNGIDYDGEEASRGLRNRCSNGLTDGLIPDEHAQTGTGASGMLDGSGQARVATAESCTGGWICESDHRHSRAVRPAFEYGIVSYSQRTRRTIVAGRRGPNAGKQWRRQREPWSRTWRWVRLSVERLPTTR